MWKWCLSDRMNSDVWEVHMHAHGLTRDLNQSISLHNIWTVQTKYQISSLNASLCTDKAYVLFLMARHHFFCNKTADFLYEPRHDKTNKVSVRPAKTQISLGIRPVWSESSLSAWRKLGSLATHWAHSEGSDQTGRMPRLIWVFAGHTCTLLVLSCCGSYFILLLFIYLITFSNTRLSSSRRRQVKSLSSSQPPCQMGRWVILGQSQGRAFLTDVMRSNHSSWALYWKVSIG